MSLVEKLQEYEPGKWPWDDFLPLIDCESARVIDSDTERFPLHWAAAKAAPIEVIERLLDAYPEAVRKVSGEVGRPSRGSFTDRGGKLPLHFAAKEGASLKVLEALLTAYPEGAAISDEGGYYPLHYAASTLGETSLESIQALLKAFPKGAEMSECYWWRFGDSSDEDGSGKLPLHIALEAHQPVDVIRALLAAFPHAVFEKGGGSKSDPPTTPVHWSYGACRDEILRVIAATPSKKRGLLVHEALREGSGLELVRALMVACPEAATTKDVWSGCLPLHVAAAKGKAALVDVILSANPDAAGAENKKGRLPLHECAAQRLGPIDAFTPVFASFPQGAMHKDAVGRLPLHYAAMSGPGSTAKVEALLTAHPEAARERDNAGMLPIHLAIGFGRCNVYNFDGDAKSVFDIFAAFPQAVAEPMPDESSVSLIASAISLRTPIHVLTAMLNALASPQIAEETAGCEGKKAPGSPTPTSAKLDARWGLPEPRSWLQDGLFDAAKQCNIDYCIGLIRLGADPTRPDKTCKANERPTALSRVTGSESRVLAGVALLQAEHAWMRRRAFAHFLFGYGFRRARKEPQLPAEEYERQTRLRLVFASHLLQRLIGSFL